VQPARSLFSLQPDIRWPRRGFQSGEDPFALWRGRSWRNSYVALW